MADEKIISPEELQEHVTAESTWVVIDQAVYDLTTLAVDLGEETPEIVAQLAENPGTDVSVLFHELSAEQDLMELFTPYKIGVYQPPVMENPPAEVEPVPQFVALDAKVAATGLSALIKTPDGLGYAYSRIILQNKTLKNIEHISFFFHLKYIDFSDNQIEDCSPIGNLENLMILKLQKNKITNLNIPSKPYLYNLDVSSNLIDTLLTVDGEAFFHPNLNTVNFNNNKLKSLEGMKSHPSLKIFEARGCNLTSTSGLPELPNLTKLYLAQNQITEVASLDGLPELEYLHLRGNELNNLSGFSENLVRLTKINLRDNKIEKATEIAKLSILPVLTELGIKGNPICDIENYRFEVILVLPNLVRLDKQEITDEERQEAREWDEQRKAEEAEKVEAERLAKLEEEEAARLAAEEEAGREKEEAEGGEDGEVEGEGNEGDGGEEEEYVEEDEEDS